MANRLEYRTNNAYDSIILVDMETGLVRSRWDVTDKSLADFLDQTQDAADWDDQHLADDGLTGDDYGELCGWRESGQGVMMSREMGRAADGLLGINAYKDCN